MTPIYESSLQEKKMPIVLMYREDKSIPGYLNKRPGKDAGYDLYAAQDSWFWPFQTKVVTSNGSFDIPPLHIGRITSRSGHAKQGWLTHPGTIDHGYAGKYGITQTNLSFLPRRIKKGTRIAQLIFFPFTAVEIDEIQDRDLYEKEIQLQSESTRGVRGYGSSGDR